MALSTIGYLLVGLFLFLILTFIYFGQTGFFQKIYKITDKLGITSISKSVEETEGDIEASGYKHTPEELATEAKVKSAMDLMAAAMESCITGSGCVCPVQMTQLPEGYAMRFINDQDKKLHISAFKYKSRNWKTDYDEDYQGQTGLHFVEDATYSLGSPVCLVDDLTEKVIGSDVSKIELRNPEINMLQLYWEDKAATLQKGTQLWATEAVSPGAIYNSENDYRIYPSDSGGYYIYRANDKRLCFFAEGWSYDDSELIDNIKCGESQEVE